jgi:hypothetical protein
MNRPSAVAAILVALTFQTTDAFELGIYGGPTLARELFSSANNPPANDNSLFVGGAGPVAEPGGTPAIAFDVGGDFSSLLRPGVGIQLRLGYLQRSLLSLPFHSTHVSGSSLSIQEDPGWIQYRYNYHYVHLFSGVQFGNSTHLRLLCSLGPRLNYLIAVATDGVNGYPPWVTYDVGFPLRLGAEGCIGMRYPVRRFSFGLDIWSDLDITPRFWLNSTSTDSGVGTITRSPSWCNDFTLHATIVVAYVLGKASH